MQTNPAILTPQHDCWDIFVTKLNAALTRQPCTDTPERPLTRKILTQLAQHDTLDVEATLRWFDSLDGYCDCEVLWHVVGKWQMKLEWHQNN